ncbi:hypothetical protein B0H14DRAFT_2671366 [Mycena olivaceomarginata]|nr:hypothetical protein B0H14DRAFT_2671366 [Mycena olivaceomarginata]
MFPKSPPPAVARDFSGLRSGVSQPFSSLQRRHRRTPRTLPRSQSNQNSCFRPPPAVDWDRDPRLRDLSRALTALGWMRLS